VSTEPNPDSFTFRAAELIRSIPKGRVATYGQIAGMAGNPRGAREVVRVLNTQKDLPWHRVLAAGGRITLPGPGGALQRKLLESEGVRFSADGTTPLASYGWQGRTRPSSRWPPRIRRKPPPQPPLSPAPTPNLTAEDGLVVFNY
jgi:methylated-DNA-protein-cysteine methyltransferase-like protein